MERYKNIGGNSGVVGYEIGSDFIKVKFESSGKVYLYDYASAGRDNIEHMKTLAKNGTGLNAFINRNVKKLYSHIE